MGCLISPLSCVQEIGRLTEEEDGPPPFRRVFKAADQRGTGTLPPLAFRRCLLDGLGFDLTEAECETLLEYLVSGHMVLYGKVILVSASRTRMFMIEMAHGSTNEHQHKGPTTIQ